MTIEKRDSFGQSREKGTSLIDAVRGKRTYTRVNPDQVIWTDGRITQRFTTVKAEDQENFSQGALVTSPNSIRLLSLPGTRARMDIFTDLRRDDINEFAKLNPSYRIRYRSTK